MQLIHTLVLTSLVVVGSMSAILHRREKPLQDVAIMSGVLAAVAAGKLANEHYTPVRQSVQNLLWTRLLKK